MRVLLIPLLLLSACSRSSEVADELPNSSLAGAPRQDVPEARLESTLARPVTIGEDGPRFAACAATGVVRGKAVAVRAAPFQEARPTGQLSDGAVLRICTRSLDQRWLGIVILSATAPEPDHAADLPLPRVEPDCGLGDPVDRRRAYTGPCQSGWVSSAQVQMVG